MQMNVQVNGVTIAVILSAFQKSLRQGRQDLLWKSAKSIVEHWGWNALKKRMLYCAAEDFGNTFLLQEIYRACPDIRLFALLKQMMEMPKSHESAWIQRIAIEENRSEGDEIVDRVAASLRLRMSEKHGYLQVIIASVGESAVGLDASEWIKMYKYGNRNDLIWISMMLRVHDPDHFAIPLLEKKESSLDDLSREWESITLLSLSDFSESDQEWIFDKHSFEGKKKKKGYAHFLHHLVLDPPLFPSGDPHRPQASALYLAQEKGVKDWKRNVIEKAPEPPHLEKYPYESLESVVRAQKRCFRFKPPVFIWPCKNGEWIVNKEVLPREKNALLLSERLKKKWNVPSLFLEHLPSGQFIYRYAGSPFLPSRDSEIVSSKIESDIRLLKAGFVRHLEEDLLDSNPISVLRALLFRWIICAGDSTPRNFVWYQNELYSIDDPACYGTAPSTLFKAKLGLVKKQKYATTIFENRVELREILLGWKVDAEVPSSIRDRIQLLAENFLLEGEKEVALSTIFSIL